MGDFGKMRMQLDDGFRHKLAAFAIKSGMSELFRRVSEPDRRNSLWVSETLADALRNNTSGEAMDDLDWWTSHEVSCSSFSST
jgi:hypothetical protein